MGNTGMGTGTGGKAFPTTRWTVIRGASDPASPTYRQSLEHLASTYWRPVYAYFRRKWGRSSEESKDLTQDFFTAMCEKDFLTRLTPDQGRFRSYIMAALDNFARLDHRARSRQKRGGGLAIVPLEEMAGFEPPSGSSPDDIFLREWARSILSEALEEMEREYRNQGQESHFKLFIERDIDPPPEPASYETLAQRFSLSVSDVTNLLYRARKKLRELVLIKVRDTVTTEDEAETEMRDLFGGAQPA